MPKISRTVRVLTNMSISLTQAQDIKSTGHILYITIISNELCQYLMNYNITNNPDVREEITKDLPEGLNSDILCATGSCVSCWDEDPRNKIFKVNEGGQLTLLDKRERSTLVGIRSGGEQDKDRKGFTGWFTIAEIENYCLKTNNNLAKIGNGRDKSPTVKVGDDNQQLGKIGAY